MDKNIYIECFYIDPGIEDFMDLNEDIEISFPDFQKELKVVG